MTDQPTVTAIMLANGRPKMLARAVHSFIAQDYLNKRLLIWNTGTDEEGMIVSSPGIQEVMFKGRGMTIGALRNEANGYAANGADILMHWDDDDWSHPQRMKEQVAMLKATGMECVGYREMLFWKQSPYPFGTSLVSPLIPGEAWLYTAETKDYCLGTSLCYWRGAWDRHPFPDSPKRTASGGFDGGTAEDLLWQREVTHEAFSTLHFVDESGKVEPRMIAGIHGGNSLSQITVGSVCWRRKPEWDAYCAEQFA